MHILYMLIIFSNALIYSKKILKFMGLGIKELAYFAKNIKQIPCISLFVVVYL